MSDQKSNRPDKGGQQGKQGRSESPWKRVSEGSGSPSPEKKKGKSGGKGNFDKFISRSNPKAEKKNDVRRDKAVRKAGRKQQQQEQAADLEGPIRLNRFIALAGVCSRREADELIAKGSIRVNGEVVKELGIKVVPGKDKVVFNRQELKVKRFVYLLMNKPKDHITTVKDDQGRRTVMELVKKYTPVRLVPVGRLDRNTTGLLLFTNDGEMTARLTHPSFEVSKVYQVRLDREVDPAHLEALASGIELEDGPIKADKVGLLENGEPNEVGVSLHSGRNRIVRRMFEHFGYKVVALDRVQFGPLDKRGLARGRCRLLTEKEIGWLKML